MTNERKAELLSLLKKGIKQDLLLYVAECNTDKELEFVRFEYNRLIAELDYSIKYFEEHK